MRHAHPFSLEQQVNERDKENGRGKEQERVNHVRVPTDPVGLTEGDLQCGVNVAAGIAGSEDHFAIRGTTAQKPASSPFGFKLIR